MADIADEIMEKETAPATVECTSSLSFDERVIKKIAGIATGNIPGILAVSGNLISGITDMFKNTDDPTKGINVEMGKQQVSISIKVICEYGRSMPEIFKNVVDTVSASIKEMTGYDVVSMNVHVHDILTKEDFDRQNKRKPEEKPESIETSEKIPEEIL